MQLQRLRSVGFSLWSKSRTAQASLRDADTPAGDNAWHMCVARRLLRQGTFASETAWAAAIAAGDRHALSKAITLAESLAPADLDTFLRVAEVLKKDRDPEQLAGSASSAPQAPPESYRLAVTGPPGVGKSTVIEQLALSMIDEDHKVAVLAIDPSSLTTGGSVLADATRMQQLVAQPNAFVRPSPSMAHLGGMTRASEQAIALCEAAGYSRVVVETVGVGQSETDASRIADVTLLLLSPMAGDHLQDMKKGVLESADVVAVTRADGATAELAASRVLELRQSVNTGLLPAAQRVVPCSGLTRQGVQEVLEAIRSTAAKLRESGALQERRKGRRKFLLQQSARRLVLNRFEQSSVFLNALPQLAKTLDGQVGCYDEAARIVYDKFVEAAQTEPWPS